jgi:trehalose 6-phosphate phosphatase
MVEIKPSDVDKGSALRRAMMDPPFAGRVPVFVGDDVTDEDGFAAVNDLGGYSIKVGLEGPTAARYRLPDVPSVHRWLRAAIA